MTLYKLKGRSDGSQAYEARQFDGQRSSIADLLQDRHSIPTGMRRGDWIIRALRSPHFNMTPDHVFRRDYVEITR